MKFLTPDIFLIEICAVVLVFVCEDPDYPFNICEDLFQGCNKLGSASRLNVYGHPMPCTSSRYHTSCRKSNMIYYSEIH